jgi:hypothetical protein
MNEVKSEPSGREDSERHLAPTDKPREKPAWETPKMEDVRAGDGAALYPFHLKARRQPPRSATRSPIMMRRYFSRGS